MNNIRPLRHIRRTFEWRDYVESNYHTKPAGEFELRINCPSCDDSKYKFYVNPEKRVFHCHKCDFSCRGGSHDVFDFVAITEGMTRNQAIIKLLQEYKTVSADEFDDAMCGLLDAPPLPHVLGKVLVPCQLPVEALPVPIDPKNAHYAYLSGRGATDREITKVLQARYIPQAHLDMVDSKGNKKGNIGNRVLWPIYRDGTLCSYQARTIQPNIQPKYLFCPETDVGTTLWPYAPPYTDTVILVEGVLDCLAARRLGAPHAAYATFSKHISKAQEAVLSSWGVTKIILLWDRRDAKPEMFKAVEQLENFTVLFADTTAWPKELDCGDCLSSQEMVDSHILPAITNPIDPKTPDIIKWELT